MENPINNQDPNETITKTPNPNENEIKTPSKKNEGNNPKLPGNDPDQTPEKETQDPPVANPEKDGDMNDPKRKKIGFNTD